MAYFITDGRVGFQPIADTSTTQQHPLGTIVRAVDGTYGEGEFIYLKGVAATAVGALVSYNATFQSALYTTALDKPMAVAVAMSANVADQYGWYQISGNAIVKKADTVSFAAGAALGANGTAGAVVVASGMIINGAVVAVVASAKTGVTTVQVMVNRPHGPSDVS